MTALIVLTLLAIAGGALAWRRQAELRLERTAYLDARGVGPRDLDEPRLLVPDPGRERWN